VKVFFTSPADLGERLAKVAWDVKEEAMATENQLPIMAFGATDVNAKEGKQRLASMVRLDDRGPERC